MNMLEGNFILPAGITLSRLESERRKMGMVVKEDEKESITPQVEGVKFDEGKARYDLIPGDSLHELAKLYTTGAAKYGDRNWESGMKWGRIFRAMMGHAWSFWRGERFDPDDGQHHLASVAWCALALMSYDIREIGEDDRSL